MAVPAYQKVKVNANARTMDNDARQLAYGAQQYFLEYNVQLVTLTYARDTGMLSGELSAYVKQISRNYSDVPSSIVLDSTFTMAHPLLPSIGIYSSEGQHRP